MNPYLPAATCLLFALVLIGCAVIVWPQPAQRWNVANSHTSITHKSARVPIAVGPVETRTGTDDMNLDLLFGPTETRVGSGTFRQMTATPPTPPTPPTPLIAFSNGTEMGAVRRTDGALVYVVAGRVVDREAFYQWFDQWLRTQGGGR